MPPSMFTHDVVIVGGCGHVGLPLALTFAEQRPAGRRLRHQRRARSSIGRRGRDAVPGDRAPSRPATRGRRRRARGDRPTRRWSARPRSSSSSSARRSTSTSTRPPRHAAALRATAAAPARRPVRHPAQHGLSRARPQQVERAAGRARAATSTSPSAPSASPRARRWRSSTRCRRSSSGCDERAVEARRRAVRQDRPTSIVRLDARGGRAGQAVHQRLALHPVRHGQPVLHDRHRLRPRLLPDPRRADRATIPRMAGLPGSGFAAGPCLFKDTMQLAAFSNNNFVLGHAAMLINEGLPQLPRRPRSSSATTARRDDRRHPRHGVQGRQRRPARVALATSCARCSSSRPAEVLCTDPYHPRTPRCSRSTRSLERSDLLFVGAPHEAYRGLAIPHGKPVVDIWNLYGNGSAGSASVKILVTGSAGFIAGYLVEELLAAGHEVVGSTTTRSTARSTQSYDDHPHYRFVAATPRTSAC